MGRKATNRTTYQITLDKVSRACVEALARMEGKSMSHTIGDCVVAYMANQYPERLRDIRRNIALLDSENDEYYEDENEDE